MQIKSPESLTQIREEYRKAFKRQKTRFLVCAGTVSYTHLDVYKRQA